MQDGGHFLKPGYVQLTINELILLFGTFFG